MDLLSEIYERYKARAERCGYRPIIPVIWGPFIELLIETLDTATRQTPSLPNELHFNIENPYEWVTEFLKEQKLSKRARSSSPLMKHDFGLKKMFELRNRMAHINACPTEELSNIPVFQKAIESFIKGLAEYKDFYELINTILENDGRLEHFSATPGSIGRYFSFLVLNSDIDADSKANKNADHRSINWTSRCLKEVTDRLITEYDLTLDETADSLERLFEALDLIDEMFTGYELSEELLHKKLDRLNGILVSSIKKCDVLLKSAGKQLSESLIRKFEQWKHIFNERTSDTEDDNSKVFLLQISSSPDGNQISINGLWYFSRENSQWSSKRLHINSFEIRDPINEFVKKIRDLIDDACDNEDIHVPNEDCILLIESDYLACQQKRFSTLFEWGHLDYKLRRLTFMGIFTMLKRKHFEWTESYVWNARCEREGFSRRELRPASHNSICTEKDLSYLRSVDQIQNMWVSRDSSSKILLIDKPSLSYREGINYYNLDKSVVTFGHPKAIHTIYQQLQTKRALSLRNFCELIGQYNHNQPKQTDKYVTVLFSYKEWEPQSPTQRMKRTTRSNNEYLANS